MGKNKHYKTLNDIIEKIDTLWGNKFTILEDPELFEYKNVHQHILIKCNTCGETYKKRINDLLHGYGCRHCTGKIFRNNDELKKYIFESTNGEYSLISDHYKTRDIATFRHNSPGCRKDDHTFQMKIHGFITLKHRCPYCNKGSKGIIESAGIIKIEEFLNSKNIEFKKEYCFDNCRGSSNLLLYFDIFIPSMNLLIEYDGIQHFKPIKYFGGEKVFKKTVENDNIKTEFAKSNNIKLVRIPYTDFSRINKILESTFNDYRKDNLEEISK